MSSLLPNGLYRISKINTTAVLKSSSPKITWVGGIIINPPWIGYKKTALFCWGGLLQRPYASVSSFPLRRTSNSSHVKFKWMWERGNLKKVGLSIGTGTKKAPCSLSGCSFGTELLCEELFCFSILIQLIAKWQEQK